MYTHTHTQPRHATPRHATPRHPPRALLAADLVWWLYVYVWPFGLRVLAMVELVAGCPR